VKKTPFIPDLTVGVFSAKEIKAGGVKPFLLILDFGTGIMISCEHSIRTYPERNSMNMIKISFPNQKNQTEGFHQLIQQVKVVCLPNDTFIIPESGLAILDALSIPYQILERGGLDYALKALRDSTAVKV
jgi:hypothetical protein